MNELERIRDQFQRAFNGQAWHGPPLMTILEDVTAEQAAAHPVPGAHSIWELCLHIGAWEDACRRRLQGDRAQLSDTEDWPTVADTSPTAWQSVKQLMTDKHQALLQAIAGVDESKLDQPIIADPDIPFSSVYVTLHGGVQHTLYHAGQIAILKKVSAGEVT